MDVRGRLTATGLIVLLAVLSYQAEPISGTIGWVVVVLFTVSFLMSFLRDPR